MKFLLAFLFVFTFKNPEPLYLYLANLSEKNKFEVYISEGSDIVFYGIVYPKRTVCIEMTNGKLYGILTKQITHNIEPSTVFRTPTKENTAKTTIVNGITYYRCVGTHLIYQLGVVTEVP